MSNLSPVPGENTANLAVVKVGNGGKISVFNDSGTTDIVVDVFGFFPNA